MGPVLRPQGRFGGAKIEKVFRLRNPEVLRVRKNLHAGLFVAN